MKKLIECVPNFSEGRQSEIIEAIVSSIRTAGVTVLDVDPGEETNRTVVTFVGEPEAVIEGALRGMATAKDRIDMRTHKGAHPRMGATDVCPLIPLSGVTLKECADWARILAERVGRELGIPVYLYGAAAERPGRVKLPDIREGEYEALEKKLKTPDFAPDYGPAKFLPASGVTAVGARDFLLAYNINLNTRNVSLARDIALSVREKGRTKRDRRGEIIRHPDGTAVKVPGILKNCQAAGWYIPEFGYAQVTMNLTNYGETGLHHGFDAVASEAQKRGLRVTGSEVVGLIPKRALLEAGCHYLEKAKLNTGIPEREILHTAVRSLGLNDTVPFVLEEKVVEMALPGRKDLLTDLSCADFSDELSSSSPAPGGGSVSALSCALSAGLSNMVANLTFGKKEFARQSGLMKELSREAQLIKSRALALVDEDTDAFNTFMDALGLPKKSADEAANRKIAMAQAARKMTEAPLSTLEISLRGAELGEKVLKRGNPSALSDAGCALAQAEAAALGAWMNVMINLPSLEDRDFAEKAAKTAGELLEKTRRITRRGTALAMKRVAHGE